MFELHVIALPQRFLLFRSLRSGQLRLSFRKLCLCLQLCKLLLLALQLFLQPFLYCCLSLRDCQLLFFPSLLTLRLQLQYLCLSRCQLLLIIFCRLRLCQLQRRFLFRLKRSLLAAQFFLKFLIPYLLCDRRVTLFIDFKGLPAVRSYQFLFHIYRNPSIFIATPLPVHFFQTTILTCLA